MRMRSHVHATAGRERRRPHVIEKHQRAHMARLQHRQHPAHRETIAQIVQATFDQGWIGFHLTFLMVRS